MPSIPIILLSILLAALVYRFFTDRRNKRSLPPLPPGPRPWPIIGNLPHLGPVPHRTTMDLIRKHGPLLYFRLGQVDMVVAASASVAAQFLKVHDDNFSSRPPNSSAKYIAYNYEDLVFRPYGPRWRMLRKITSVHFLSGKALEDFRHVRQEEVAVLVRGLAKAGSNVVNLGQRLNLCTANNLGRVTLGYRVFGDGSGKTDPKADEFKSLVVEAMRLSGIFNIGDFLPGLDWLDLQRVAARMKKVHNSLDAFLSKIIEEHKAKVHKEHNNDMLSMLISLKENVDDEDGGKLTDIEIKALFLNMFIAGTDTSSSTVEWAIAELIRHPKIMARVQEELDRVVGKDRLVNESDLPELTYLKAVVKETFRLHPATPLSLPRMASESCEINGYHIPKGTMLFVNQWAIGRDPAEWTNPLEFRPERFLPGGEKAHVDVRGNNFEVIPFGSGRRICAGVNLGIRMVQIITSSLVHAFNFGLPDGLIPENLNMDEIYGQTAQRAAPLMVYPQPRLAPPVYRA